MKKYKYKQVTVHNHPFFPGRKQVKRSRLVMAEYLGRSLLRTELVHHKNEDTMDDEIDNLELVSRGKHNTCHKSGKHHTAKARKKISLGNIGKCRTAETKRKISLNHIGFKGKHHTAETRKKMSRVQKCHPGFWLGKHRTVEVKMKMSLARRDYCLQQKFPGL